MARHGPKVHLNPRVKNIGVSATLAINDRSDALRREGREIFKLGLGESPFPVPHPVVEALRAAADQKSYLPVRGLQELRETVAENHRCEFGIDRDSEDVLIAPRSKELMFSR